MFTTAKAVVLLSCAVALLVASRFAGAEPTYGFGRVADDAEVAAADLDVRFDGTGLPAGSGSAEQGAAIYAAQCASCHGAELEGNRELYIKPLLSDKRHSITMRPYAPPLFAYIRRSMPLTAPGSLSDDESYALVAFLLREAGVDPQPEAPMDAARLRAIDMPNRENFVPAANSGVAPPE